MALQAQVTQRMHAHHGCFLRGLPSMYTALHPSRTVLQPKLASPSTDLQARATRVPSTLNCRCPSHKTGRTGRSAARHAYTGSASWSSTPPSGGNPTFSASGPYRIAELGPITVQLGYSNGSPVTMQLEVCHPAGSHKAPLAIISAGFLLNGSLYRSYAEELARWGYVTVLYDLSELFDDLTTVNHLRSIIDFCATDPRLSPLVDSDTVYLAGHSRGGKLSCLTAARDERVKALCLMDPVDVTPMTPKGPGYPSCLAGLRNITSPRGRCVPVLVVGAGSNGDVIPASGNYKRFTSNCLGPCWEVDLLGAGHLQFLDRQVPLLTAFSAPGPTPDTTVRQVTCSALVAWAEKIVRPRQLQQPISVQDLQEFLSQEGRVFEQLAPAQITINNLHTLQFASWQQQARRGARSSSSIAYSGAGYRANAASSSVSNSTPGWGSNSAPATEPSYGGNYAGGSSSGNGAGYSYSGANSAASSGSGGDQGRRVRFGSDPFGSNVGRGYAGAAARKEPVMDSYEELMKRRARELKDMLVQRGIDCSDCYEKSELAQRLVERAGVRGMSGRY